MEGVWNGWKTGNPCGIHMEWYNEIAEEEM
jgi:hypothetical protein